MVARESRESQQKLFFEVCWHCTCEVLSSCKPRTIWIHAIEAGVGLELRAQLGGESQALLLACQLHQVGSLTHDSCTSRGHLEDLLFLCRPCDHIELFCLRMQTTVVSRGVMLSTDHATRPAHRSRSPVSTSLGPAASTTIPPRSSSVFDSRQDNGGTDVVDFVPTSTVLPRVRHRGLPYMSRATSPFARSAFSRFRSLFDWHWSVDRGRPRCFVPFVFPRPFHHG